MYIIIGALIIIAAVFAYQYFQERRDIAEIEINFGEDGISVERK
ncbi:hypothetical protein EKH55_2334 [Sinorhizobium alkalisoli]|nr:hypothetical protein EKH55_2334 [Sinorhizobium alkalisoli]